MNSDIRLAADFPTHPKVLRLIDLAGYEAAHRLVCLWVWVSQNRPDRGDLSGIADEQIERLVGWSGRPGVFMAALATVGLVDRGCGKRLIHDWTINNGYAARANLRRDWARKAAATKWEKIRGDAEKMRPDVPPQDATSPVPSPVPKEKESVPTIPRSGNRASRTRPAAPPHTPVTDSLPDSNSGNDDEAPTSPPPTYLRDVPAMQLCQVAAKTLEAQLENRGAHKLRSRVLHEIGFLGVDTATNRPMLDCPGDLHTELLIWLGAQGLTRQLEELSRRLVRRSNGTAAPHQEPDPPPAPPGPDDQEADFPPLPEPQETAP